MIEKGAKIISDELRAEIKRKREEKGWSQLEWAKEAGFSEAAVGFLEHGPTQSLTANVKKMIEVLDIDPDDFPCGKGKVKKWKYTKKPKLKKISAKLRKEALAIMKDKGLSQKALAKRAGIQNPVVNCFVKGKSKKITPQVEKVLNALGINSKEYSGGRRSHTKKSKKSIGGHNDFKAQVLQVIENYGDAMYEQGKEDALAKLKETLGV